MLPDLKMIRGEIWSDVKEHWREWARFVFYEIPRDLIKEALK